MRDLGDGLRMRWATPADAEALVVFNVGIHTHADGTEDGGLRASLTDIVQGHRPEVKVEDFLLVEDAAGTIVSSSCLMRPTWLYEGIELPVGQPEFIGTSPAYRRRGLVRAQFEEVHAASGRSGHLLQVIAGIPHFYHQFGYEQAVDMVPRRSGHPRRVPALPEGRPEPFTCRPATADDLPFIVAVYRTAMSRYRLAIRRDLDEWRYEVSGREQPRDERLGLHLIERDGRPVGWLMVETAPGRPCLDVHACELSEGESWLEPLPGLLRFLKRTGEESAGGKAFDTLQFRVPLGHPVNLAARLALPETSQPYAWYVRVPDLAAFLRHVAPALEARLAASPLAGHSGDLRLGFYRHGVRLTFESGRLAQAERTDTAGATDARIPERTFRC